MGRARFSIAGAVLVIAVTAVGLTALREATEFWFGVIAALTGLGIVLSVIRAAFGPARLLWAGCAVGGCLYLVFAFSPWFRVQTLGPRLRIDRFLERAADFFRIQPRARLERYDPRGRVVMHAVFSAEDGSAEREATSLLIKSGGSSYVALPPEGSWINASVVRDDREDFKHIGHLLIAWLFGLVGGVFGLMIHWAVRRRRSAESGG